MDRLTSQQTLATIRRFEEWARENALVLPEGFASNAGELYTAAAGIIVCIDELLGRAPLTVEARRRLVVELGSWLQDELPDHLDAVRATFEAFEQSLHEPPGGHGG